jgi:hypothetical protein
VSTRSSLTYRSHFLTFPHHRFLPLIFSSTYKSLSPQPLSFLIYTNPRGVAYPPAAPQPCVGGSIFRFPLSFPLFADSLRHLQNSTLVFSNGCGLFRKNAGCLPRQSLASAGGLQLDAGTCRCRASFEFRFSSFAFRLAGRSGVPTRRRSDDLQSTTGEVSRSRRRRCR